MINYSINSEGRVFAIGLEGHIFSDIVLTDEPFGMHDAFDWRKDLETNEWVYDPIIQIPMEISKYQLVKHLLSNNRYNELIASIDNDADKEKRIIYDSVHAIRVESEVFEIVRTALNLSIEEMKTLFLESTKYN